MTFLTRKPMSSAEESGTVDSQTWGHLVNLVREADNDRAQKAPGRHLK